MVPSALLWRAASLIALVLAFQVAAARGSALHREAKRRWQHAVTGHALVVISYFLPPALCAVLLTAAAAGLWYVRHYCAEMYFRYFGPLLRPHELVGHSAAATERGGGSGGGGARSSSSSSSSDGTSSRAVLPGAFWFLVGAAVTVLLVPMTTARYAVECLALADPAAAYIGQSVPSSRRLTKTATVAGSAACFVTACAVGGAFLLPQPSYDATTTATANADATTFSFSALVVVLAGAAACTAAEAAPFGNDNLTIPVVTALTVELVRRLTAAAAERAAVS